MATISGDRSPPASLSQPQSQSQSPNPDAGANTDTNITGELQQIPQTRLSIKTYHCTFCNHLLLASTRDLHLLPRRREPARDRALILPLPKAGAGEEEEEGEEEGESEVENGAEDAGEAAGDTVQRGTDEPTTKSRGKKKTKLESAQQEQQQQQQQHYTILLSTTIPDRKPTMIRREDGFEKRLLLRCGRCRVVMGYALDEIHFAAAAAAAAAGEGGGGDGDGKTAKEKEDVDGEGDGEDNKEDRGRERRRRKAEEVVYILPGALVETGEMGKVEMEEWAGWEKGRK
ncbi:uncharacterized protein BDCG_06374 [Blastomyces dermatitidis ER-3]|uniref:STEEP1 domain-containing protein n=1 Tax=Ajellomyces dermatitidis (strain ER-3 / ATCC MYA-2586) TaxID=559297 RepID=A0ABP2F4N8_AJEDR|nr:uncharacterized protein BDCG_06374 [Blastomyces dermatitidis ER-3]EEQ91254.1 hypothetical protein BDCG_06374 [Blastomyces dermatitidis ER-3]